jgi:hypothetical protein
MSGMTFSNDVQQIWVRSAHGTSCEYQSVLVINSAIIKSTTSNSLSAR